MNAIKNKYIYVSCFYRNYLRMCLAGGDTHTRLIISQITPYFKNKNKKLYDDLEKFNETYDDYINRRLNHKELLDQYNTGYEYCKLIEKEIPFLYKYPIKFEEKLLQKGILNNSLLDKLVWKRENTK